ncbi:PilW family protein [Salinicola tamaricis]|uniref:PilW family protein n=1 Tax=Salinicola tamaricis TaxID=1771309 RepID=UPI000D0A6F14|nr:prepilin-type N-terminal cleavage/methylation domain-containing protein [Salinicola tamaricis]
MVGAGGGRGPGRADVPRGQAGATLIELMIAMAIGLVMILALTRVYLASAESAADAAAQARLMDKARLLQERFNSEFRRADFWGRVPADAERGAPSP